MNGYLLPLIVLLISTSLAYCSAPEGSSVIFSKGEGGYYCHKIPVLFRTHANTLLAFAEARGGNGRSACDDFTVR